jgi:RNA polymerase sigma factor (sigma-70 family)
MVPHAALARHLRRLAAPPARETAPDAELLGRFIARKDQDAFAALVARHGAMVLAVCRRVLPGAADAEDAFQATFLLLARKAAGLRRPAALAAWLHGVALRVSRKARTAGIRRAAAPLAHDVPDGHPDPLDVLTSRELLAILDEEVGRLPEAYRLPVVLCYLQGRTAAEAARMLGWTAGSVRGRLERGRARLQQRLTRRGLAVPAGLLTAALAAPPSAPAAILEAAISALAKGVPASPRVAALATAAGGALAVRLKLAAALLLALGALAAGAAAVRQPASSPEPPAARALPPADDRPARRDRYGDPLPEGAIARLGTVRLRHSFTVYSVAFSPDGTRLATTGGFSSGRPLVVWDAATGRELFEVPAPGSVIAAPFTPDGKSLLIITRRNGVYRWDAVTGKQGEHIADTGDCRCAALTPDGRSLAVATADPENQSIRLFGLSDGKEIRTMTDKGLTVYSLAVAPDGRSLASVSDDGTVRLWETATGGEVRKISSDAGKVWALAYSPDGRTLATGDEDGAVRLWDPATGKERRSLDLGMKAPVRVVRYSPDGKALAAGVGGSIRLWDVAEGKELRRWDDLDYTVGNLAFTADGKTLAGIGWVSSAVRLYDATTGKQRPPDAGHTNSVATLRFAADGKTLASVGRNGDRFFWDLAAQRGERGPSGPPQRMWICNALSPDGKTLATAEGAEGLVRLWDFATGKELATLSSKGAEVNGMAFSPDGRILAVAARDATIRLFDAEGRRELRRMKGVVESAGFLVFSPDGKVLASAIEGVSRVPPIRLWDVATGELIRRLDGPRWQCNLAFSPDGKYLAAGGIDDSRGKMLVRAAYGKSAWVWETATWKRRWMLDGHEKGILALAFSPDGKRLATGACEGEDKVRLFDLEGGKELACFAGHHSAVLSLAFSPDGRTLASGAGDSTILLWDVGRK